MEQNFIYNFAKKRAIQYNCTSTIYNSFRLKLNHLIRIN